MAEQSKGTRLKEEGKSISWGITAMNTVIGIAAVAGVTVFALTGVGAIALAATAVAAVGTYASVKLYQKYSAAPNEKEKSELKQTETSKVSDRDGLDSKKVNAMKNITQMQSGLDSEMSRSDIAEQIERSRIELSGGSGQVASVSSSHVPAAHARHSHGTVQFKKSLPKGGIARQAVGNLLKGSQYSTQAVSTTMNVMMITGLVAAGALTLAAGVALGVAGGVVAVGALAYTGYRVKQRMDENKAKNEERAKDAENVQQQFVDVLDNVDMNNPGVALDAYFHAFESVAGNSFDEKLQTVFGVDSREELEKVLRAKISQASGELIDEVVLSGMLDNLNQRHSAAIETLQDNVMGLLNHQQTVTPTLMQQIAMQPGNNLDEKLEALFANNAQQKLSKEQMKQVAEKIMKQADQVDPKTKAALEGVPSKKSFFGGLAASLGGATFLGGMAMFVGGLAVVGFALTPPGLIAIGAAAVVGATAGTAIYLKNRDGERQTEQEELSHTSVVGAITESGKKIVTEVKQRKTFGPVISKMQELESKLDDPNVPREEILRELASIRQNLEGLDLGENAKAGLIGQLHVVGQAIEAQQGKQVDPGVTEKYDNVLVELRERFAHAQKVQLEPASPKDKGPKAKNDEVIGEERPRTPSQGM